MKSETKARIKTLEYLQSALKVAQKARDPRERLAAVELEVEFADRIEQLRKADREPELSLQAGEPALVGAAGR